MATGHRLTDLTVLDPEICPAGTRRGYRIRYRSFGRTTTGSVFLPERADAAAELPLLTWAHCFVGLDQRNAPSTRGLPRVERAHLATWLAQGYAVAAADYTGLDGDGINPFPRAEKNAQDILGICAAARELGENIGGTVVAAGFCQGADAVMHTSGAVPSVDFELDYLGTIALAPPDYPTYFTTVTRDSDFAADALVFALLAGIRAHDPSFHPEEFLTAPAVEFLKIVASLSVSEMRRIMEPYTVGELGIHNVTDRFPVSNTLLHSRNTEIVNTHPLFLGTMEADPLTPRGTIRRTIEQCSSQGAVVTDKSYVGQHMDILSTVTTDAVAWANDLPRPRRSVEYAAGVSASS